MCVRLCVRARYLFAIILTPFLSRIYRSQQLIGGRSVHAITGPIVVVKNNASEYKWLQRHKKIWRYSDKIQYLSPVSRIF